MNCNTECSDGCPKRNAFWFYLLLIVITIIHFVIVYDHLNLLFMYQKIDLVLYYYHYYVGILCIILCIII